MSAYGIEYLDDAMRNLGEMTDYAVNACGMDLEDFWKLFLTTGYAEKFEILAEQLRQETPVNPKKKK